MERSCSILILVSALFFAGGGVAAGDICSSSRIPATEGDKVGTIDGIDAIGTFTLSNEGHDFILTSSIGAPFTMRYPRVKIGNPQCWDITEDYVRASESGGYETSRYWVAVCSSNLSCRNGKLEVSFAPRLKRAISGRRTAEDIIFSGCYYRSNIDCEQ
jgi:hypothetical protein